MQPYVASIPHPLDDRLHKVLPVVVLLHDFLLEPTSKQFIESAFVHAAAWLPIQMRSMPAILLQPYAFGNSGWIGWGAVQLADALKALKSRFRLQPSRLALLGNGSGGTGALQLASLLPDAFDAIAAIDPQLSTNLDFSLESARPSAWEIPARKSIDPMELMSNLVGAKVHLQTGWRATGLNGSSSSSNARQFVESAARSKVAIKFVDRTEPMLHAASVLPANPESVWNDLIGAEGISTCSEIAFTSGCHRFQTGRGISFSELNSTGLQQVRIACGGDSLVVKTKSVTTFDFAPQRDFAKATSAQFGKQTLKLPNATDRVLRFDRVGSQWQVALLEKTADVEIFQPLRATFDSTGQMLEVFFRRPTIVFGTLGDERQNLIMKQLAQTLSRRLQNGDDSANIHPCDRTSTLKLPLASDVEMLEKPLGDFDLIVLGTPQTNLVLARIQGRIPINWQVENDGDKSRSKFQLGNRRYDRPRDALAAIFANPLGTNRIVVAMTATHHDALVDLARLRLAFCPGFVAVRDGCVDSWGNFDVRSKPEFQSTARPSNR